MAAAEEAPNGAALHIAVCFSRGVLCGNEPFKHTAQGVGAACRRASKPFGGSAVVRVKRVCGLFGSGVEGFFASAAIFFCYGPSCSHEAHETMIGGVDPTDDAQCRADAPAARISPNSGQSRREFDP